MKGYKVDVKRKKVEFVNDKLPFPNYPPYEESEGVDLEKVKKLVKMQSIDWDKVDIEKERKIQEKMRELALKELEKEEML